MPIGKDSIQKRVAKTAPEVKEEIVTEKVTPPTEQKAPAAPKKTTTTAKKATTTTKKATTSTQKKTTTSTAKKSTAAKKPAAPKSAPATTVLANVSPETVEKVTGHKEGARPECIGIGQKLPTHLL